MDANNTKEELLQEISRLEKEVCRLKAIENDHRKLLRELYDEAQKNDRNAGRKPLSEITRQKIQDLRAKGLTMREIAKETNVSLGAVHRYL